jgi:hypothetical protein
MVGLRRALAVHVVGYEYREDHTEYVVWVHDAATGLECTVLHRFKVVL